jgi:hypothetical protein
VALDIKHVLTEKLGPLPAWGWVGIGAGVYFLFFRSSSSPGTAAVNSVAPGVGQYIPSSGGTSGGGVSAGGPLCGPGTQVDPAGSGLCIPIAGQTQPPQPTANVPSVPVDTSLYTGLQNEIQTLAQQEQQSLLAQQNQQATFQQQIQSLLQSLTSVGSGGYNGASGVGSSGFSTNSGVYNTNSTPTPPPSGGGTNPWACLANGGNANCGFQGGINPYDATLGTKYTPSSAPFIPSGSSTGYSVAPGTPQYGQNYYQQVLGSSGPNYGSFYNNLWSSLVPGWVSPSNAPGYEQGLINNGTYTRYNSGSPYSTNVLGVSGQYVNGVWTPIG